MQSGNRVRRSICRQYYIYVTDPNCKRLGTQCWVYCAIMVSEAVLCVKNARELFERTQAVNIIVWLLIQLIISIIFVYGCIMYHRYTQVRSTYRSIADTCDVAPDKNTFRTVERVCMSDVRSRPTTRAFLIRMFCLRPHPPRTGYK